MRPVLGAADDLACDALGDGAVADLERPGNAPAEEDVEACALDGVGYRLGEAAVDGGVVSVELRAATDSYLVEIVLDDDAAQAMSDLTSDAASSDSQVALVADGARMTEAASDVAAATGLSRRELYEAALRSRAADGDRRPPSGSDRRQQSDGDHS